MVATLCTIVCAGEASSHVHGTSGSSGGVRRSGRSHASSVAANAKRQRCDVMSDSESEAARLQAAAEAEAARIVAVAEAERLAAQARRLEADAAEAAQVAEEAEVEHQQSMQVRAAATCVSGAWYG